MSCKYDIIDEGGRKRVRALRSFTVQGRDVCPMELGGYVYDANTLSQDGNCWIFSGSLEYPGVRVMDEAIVDMGNNLPRVATRPKATIIPVIPVSRELSRLKHGHSARCRPQRCLNKVHIMRQWETFPLKRTHLPGCVFRRRCLPEPRER